MDLTIKCPCPGNDRSYPANGKMPIQRRRRGVRVPRHILIASALQTAVAACALAQPAGQRLTLRDCVRLAETVPSAVSIARLERDIAARDAAQARSSFFPQSRLTSGSIYNSPLLYDRQAFSFVPLNGIREFASLLTVNQELDLSGRLRADLSHARASRDQAEASAGITQRNLRQAVAAAYYRVLLTRHIARVLQDVLDESKNFERRASLLVQGGEAARADLVKASAQAANLQQACNAAELEAKLAVYHLASFWTKEPPESLFLEDVFEEDPPPPEAEPAQPAPFLRRLEFNLLDAQRKGFQADARLARASLLPQLNLTFQYGIDSTAVRIRDRGYAAFFNLTIPLFDWNRARHAIAQARLRGEQTALNRALSERVFSQQYRSALARARQLFGQIALARQQVKLAEEDLRLSRLRYEGGEGPALEVVVAQNQLASARSNYYMALASYFLARADLEVAAGR